MLPWQGVVAELGVAEGDFSRQILNSATPRELHLVDLWRHQDIESYQRDPSNVPNESQEQRYRGVQQRFAQEILQGQVVLHHCSTREAAASFTKHLFDWVYLDAMHTYEAVLGDLERYYELVKPDGFICGHDYANSEPARWMKFGVIEAVNDFVQRSGCSLLLLTDEPWPTYILAKDLKSPKCRQMENAILRHMKFIKIYGFLERRFQQMAMVDQAGRLVKTYTTIR